MNTKTLFAAFMIMVVVVLAGCTAPTNLNFPSSLNKTGNQSSGEGGTPQPTGPGVVVSDPTCVVDGSPCTNAQITRFSIPKMSVSAHNTGNAPAQIELNKNTYGGRGVLVSTCPQYNVKNFRATISKGASTRDVSGKGSVTLQPGESLDMVWFVELSDQVQTVNTTISCLFRFQTTIAQQLTTVKQVQVRGGTDIPRISDLTYETTASNPVELVIDAKDSVVQQLIGNEVAPIQAKAYLLNPGSGTITDAHAGNGKRIALTIPGVQHQCVEQPIRTNTGSQTSLEQGVLCKFTLDRIETSQVYEFHAQTTYTYKEQLQPVELSLGTLEAGG